MAREILEKTELDSDESIIFLDVKGLYTNVPLKKAVEIALTRLYAQINPPKISGKSMKILLNLAVSEIHFKRNGLCYVEKKRFSNGHLLCSKNGQFVAQRIRSCNKERSTKIDCAE